MPSPSRTAAEPFSRPFEVEAKRDYPVKMDISATPEECLALAAALDIPAISAVSAKFRITREPRGRFLVTGEVAARVTRDCVISLEPFETDVVEPVEIEFQQAAKPARRGPPIAEREVDVATEVDPPEPIVDGRIDLGAVAREFLALGLDPYPKKPGVAFEEKVEPDEPAASPFAVLGRLRGKDSTENE
jgi:uncharacterized metal-binding protein YceD (DUF177 family)